MGQRWCVWGEEDTGRLRAERVRNTHWQRRQVTGAEDGNGAGGKTDRQGAEAALLQPW